MRVLVMGPALRDPGGVSAYYLAVLPELRSQSNNEVNDMIRRDQRCGKRCSGELRPWSGLRNLIQDYS